MGIGASTLSILGISKSEAPAGVRRLAACVEKLGDVYGFRLEMDPALLVLTVCEAHRRDVYTGVFKRRAGLQIPVFIQVSRVFVLAPSASRLLRDAVLSHRRTVGGGASTYSTEGERSVCKYGWIGHWSGLYPPMHKVFALLSMAWVSHGTP